MLLFSRGLRNFLTNFSCVFSHLGLHGKKVRLRGTLPVEFLVAMTKQGSTNEPSHNLAGQVTPGAREAGITERSVDRIAGEPETQFLTAHIMRPYRGKLMELVEKSLIAVEDALTATVGQGKRKRPNHEIRLHAVKQLVHLLRLAEGEPTDHPPQLHSWEDFVLTYHKHKQEEARKQQEAAREQQEGARKTAA
jgi:hypothetical protein